MVFKLVRIDISDPCKVLLPQGTHTLGRGTFLKSLECDDKRVSRKHGKLDVTKDSVFLTALNRNPCFYLKKNLPETQILQLESSIGLTNGDRFGLLPNSYWYELMLCADDVHSEDNNTLTNVNVIQENVETEVELITNNDSNNVLDLTLEDENNANEDGSKSPSLLPPETNTSSTKDNNTEDYVQPTAVKRSHSQVDEQSSSADTIRVENGESSAKVKVKKEDIDDQPGTSNDNNNAGNMPPSPNKPAHPLRERCWYGAQCYRKNPTHKSDFSHPSDSDWGGDTPPPCPRGAACAKRDPRHWRDHTHPHQLPPPPPPQGRRKKRVVSESEEEEICSDGSTSEVLPAKRVRKPRQTIDFSDDDESDKDPYATDQDSDEWVPSQTQGSSMDFSQTQDF